LNLKILVPIPLFIMRIFEDAFLVCPLSWCRYKKVQWKLQAPTNHSSESVRTQDMSD